ncbi:MAG: SAM-dependent chlorinase/fluorinase [Deltaproteobacteria bacterium]
MAALVTLLTDFGMADGYVGAMKGVMYSLCPGLTIVDLSHEIAAHDIRAGALVLASAALTFPPGTVHLAVVDPGVGGPRRGLLVESGGHSFVGPDNGLLSLAANAPRRIYTLDRPEYFRRPLSTTFHGRDMFAPVAAHRAAGKGASELASETGSMTELEVARARLEDSGGFIEGEVVSADRFGNLITNIPAAMLGVGWENALVKIKGAVISGVVSAYADGSRGHLLALLSSSGFLEIAAAEASALEVLGLSEPRGCEVTVQLLRST